MKKSLVTLSLILMINFGLYAQVVINEVLYNIPGLGEDEEFIELYNAGSSSVNLTNYTFTQGVTHTFTGGTIAPGGYFVIAFDSAAYHTSFGMAPDAVWTSGGLSNGGEDIAILDGNGITVDSVNYDDATPWPLSADGQGRSLQLCDHTTDNNDGANWGTTNTSNGVNGQTGTDLLYATPGAVNSCVAVIPATYPLYTISQINGIDANGLADSVGVTCELRAVAQCINNRASQSGYDFPFANSNNVGIRVFGFNDVSGYQFSAGDSLHISGTVSQYNGLLQFSPDSISLVALGAPTPAPMTVSVLDESTENKFVMLNGVHVVDTAAWTNGVGFGFTVRITNGNTDTMDVRVDSDSDLFNQPAPLGNFSIKGWGSQYDVSNPYTDFYQLIPCNATNITSTKAVESHSSQVNVYPNPTQNILNIESDLNIESIQIYNTLGQMVFNQLAVENNAAQISTASLDNGVYIISIQTENRVMTQQIQVLR